MIAIDEFTAANWMNGLFNMPEAQAAYQQSMLV
jgi:hypothetical protein